MDLLFEKAICTIMNFALSIESRFSYTQDTAVNDYLKTEDKRDQRIGGVGIATRIFPKIHE